MDASALIAVAGGLTAAVAALALRFGPRLRRARTIRRLSDPACDPGQSAVTPALAERWGVVIDAPARDAVPLSEAWAMVLSERDTPQLPDAVASLRHHGQLHGVMAVGLTLAHPNGSPWRAALRRLPAIEGDAPEVCAVRAEHHLALGELEAAERIIDQLPADDWRACRVRGCLYALRGDLERADSAHHAAWALAPDAARPALRRRGAGLTVRGAH